MPIPRIAVERLDRALCDYKLDVSTIGETVYRPEEWSWARDDFYFYAVASRDGSGKAAGAKVVLWRDGEVVARWPEVSDVPEEA